MHCDELPRDSPHYTPPLHSSTTLLHYTLSLPSSSFDRNFLYRRALVLQRFITLVDSVLPHIVPKWEHSIGKYNSDASHNSCTMSNPPPPRPSPPPPQTLLTHCYTTLFSLVSTLETFRLLFSGTYDVLKVIRQLLPLSKKRMSLVETFLHESETPRPGRMPKLYINRRAAADHKSGTLEHFCSKSQYQCEKCTELANCQS